MALARISNISKGISLPSVMKPAFSLGIARFSMENLRKTALHDLHEELGGKMVPFAGYRMPVQYKMGVLGEHMHTRTKAGLFDVSHMLQLRFHGKDINEFLERIIVADMSKVKPGDTKYSLITNENGGVVDDTVVTNKGDYVYMVVNAACAQKDLLHINHELAKFQGEGKDCELAIHTTTNSLIALQGPMAHKVLSRFVRYDLSKQKFMSNRDADVMGLPCYVGRCGYTGEDGFEISVPTEAAVDFTKVLLREPEVAPAGLGARDSLRLEAGLCLYGNDLTEETSPVEGNLNWAIAKRRKQEGGFLGDKIILKHLKEGTTVLRQGLLIDGVAREHSRILDMNGKLIGEVNSGGFSPILKKGVGMGYIPAFYKAGDQVKVEYKGKELAAKVVKTPFVKTNYYSMKK